MSSIFSDPFFRRGSTLLGGEPVELNSSNEAVAGGEVIGQVKAFQDVNPAGQGERYSNRLVYCVAARYLGNDATGADLAGEVVTFNPNGPLSTFGIAGQSASAALATVATVAAGLSYGVVDEYLTAGTAIRKNDIVWIVVKGPTTACKQAGASGFAVNAGVAVVAAATNGCVAPVGAASAGTVQIADNIGGASVSTATTIRINLWSSRI